MELIHSTFQASFNARIERLAEQEANELRTIFRFFDTDDDGAVSADQVLRIFGLLGLDINPAYVRDLEVVYLAEFLKIVDSHIPVKEVPPVEHAAAPVSNGSQAVVPTLAGTGLTPIGSSPEVPAVLNEEAQANADAKLWDEEWRALDAYRRGLVTHDELRFFLKSCFSPFPVHDLDRFLELYADSSTPEDSMELTKASFIRFRRDYTTRERAQSEHSSDEEDEEEGEGDVTSTGQTTRAGDPDRESAAPQESDGKKRRATRSSSLGPAGAAAEADVEGIVIDPNVVDDEFADEEAADDVDGSSASHGQSSASIFEEEDEDGDVQEDDDE